MAGERDTHRKSGILPTADKIAPPVLGAAAVFDALGFLQAIKEHRPGNAAVEAAIFSVVIFSAYMLSAMKKDPQLEQKAHEDYLENPYREFISAGIQQIAANITADYDLASAFGLDSDKQTVFTTFLAAYLLDRDHILPSAEDTGFANSEDLRDRLIPMTQGVERLLLEAMPLVHGRVKEELLQQATEQAKTIDSSHGSHSWGVDQIASAASEIADAFGGNIVGEILEEFIPAAHDHAMQASPSSPRMRRKQNLYYEYLNAILESMLYPTGAASQAMEETEDALKNRIEDARDKILRKYGKNQ